MRRWTTWREVTGNAAQGASRKTEPHEPVTMDERILTAFDVPQRPQGREGTFTSIDIGVLDGAGGMQDSGHSPDIWGNDRALDQEGLRGIKELHGGMPGAGQNGHSMVPRLLCQGRCHSIPQKVVSNSEEV